MSWVTPRIWSGHLNTCTISWNGSISLQSRMKWWSRSFSVRWVIPCSLKGTTSWLSRTWRPFWHSHSFGSIAWSHTFAKTSLPYTLNSLRNRTRKRRWSSLMTWLWSARAISSSYQPYLLLPWLSSQWQRTRIDRILRNAMSTFSNWILYWDCFSAVLTCRLRRGFACSSGKSTR